MIFGPEALSREVPRGAQGLQQHIVVFAADRHVVEDQISHLAQHLVEGAADFVLRSFCLLHHVGELLGAAQQLRTVLTASLRYPLAERLLLGPKLFELCTRVATRLVSLDQVVHQRLRLPASSLGGPYLVWIDAEHLDINHRASLTSKVRRSDLIVIARAIPTLAISR